MVKRILFVALLTFGSNALAAHKVLHGYFAAGELYVTPAAARIGSGAWEGGLITSTFYGVQKIFDAGPNVYTTFGLGVARQGSFSPAILGGVGYSISFWVLQLRAELNAGASFSTYSHASALLGLAMGF